MSLAHHALDIPIHDRILYGRGRISEIANSPRLPDAAQTEATLRSVAG